MRSGSERPCLHEFDDDFRRHGHFATRARDLQPPQAQVTGYLSCMAKSKNMRWFHRAFARAAQLTGRTDAVEQGVRLADGLAQSVSSQGAMPRRAALKTMGTLAALPLMSAGCSKERRLANARVAIIGGGLAGLTAAVRLKEMGVTPLLFEATERFGGRVRFGGGVSSGHPAEQGA